MNGGWVPFGHPAANSYLEQPLAVDYSGAYTLTLTADSCPAGVPEVAKQRVYAASVAQIGARLRVFLTGPDLLVTSNRAFGGIVVSGEEARFEISPPDFYYYYFFGDLTENIAGVGGFSVFGVVYATITPAGFLGTRMLNRSISGSSVLFVGANTFPFWECTFNRFELLRQ